MAFLSSYAVVVDILIGARGFMVLLVGSASEASCPPSAYPHPRMRAPAGAGGPGARTLPNMAGAPV